MGYDGVVRFFWNGPGGHSTHHPTLEDALADKHWRHRGSKSLSTWVLQVTAIPRFLIWSWDFPIPEDYNRLTLNNTESIIEARKRAAALKQAKKWAEEVARKERRVFLEDARRQAREQIEEERQQEADERTPERQEALVKKP
tara:strand:- start:9073 stop:9498 length:426 start_codon:yes stop_codon:yes gene_type:complete